MSDTDIVTRLRDALATELFRIVASGRCEKDGTRLVDGRCSWCEMFARAALSRATKESDRG